MVLLAKSLHHSISGFFWTVKSSQKVGRITAHRPKIQAQGNMDVAGHLGVEHHEQQVPSGN